MTRHYAHHAVTGAGIYLAGRSARKAARLGWLLVAAYGFCRCAQFHHGRV